MMREKRREGRYRNPDQGGVQIAFELTVVKICDAMTFLGSFGKFSDEGHRRGRKE
jgi:hypothetical protein